MRQALNMYFQAAEQRGVDDFPIVSQGSVPEHTDLRKRAVEVRREAARWMPVEAVGSSENWKK